MNEQDKPQNEEGAPVDPRGSGVAGTRGWLMAAGEWLQRPPGAHMGSLTTAVVLVVMFLLVWVSSWFF